MIEQDEMDLIRIGDTFLARYGGRNRVDIDKWRRASVNNLRLVKTTEGSPPGYICSVDSLVGNYRYSMLDEDDMLYRLKTGNREDSLIRLYLSREAIELEKSFLDETYCVHSELPPITVGEFTKLW